MGMLLWSFFIVIAGLAIFNGLRALRRYGVRGVWGEASRPTIIAAVIIILVAWGLFAATQLGFIPNHAP